MGETPERPESAPSPGAREPGARERGAREERLDRSEERAERAVTGNAGLAGEPGVGPPGGAESWLELAPREKRRTKWRIRLAVCATLGTLVLGGWWLRNEHAQRTALTTFDRELPAAELALAEGDLTTAARHYGQVLESLERLGRADSRGLKIRQTARETVAAAGLCSVHPSDMLREATSASGLGAGVWEAAFRQQYQGQWVIFDLTVQRMREGGQRHSLDCPIHPDGEAVRLSCEFPQLESLPLLTDEPRRVVLAGQLTACRPPGPEQPRWEIELDRRTAFLWVDPASLRKLGFPIDERLEGILREQAQVGGLEP